MRILDLHHSGENETVISIPGLVTQAIPNIGESTRGLFQILYYSDDIVSCLYRSSTCLNPVAWLIAFNAKAGRILTTMELESTYKIFVRHNKEVLYYGTHSEIGTDGYRNWVVRGYDFKSTKWFDQKIYLSDIVGSEVNSTVCFELHQGYFYALSNQTSFEVEEIDWTSFYHCIRFPQSSPGRQALERTRDRDMWRRQHQEGPIDDRWTSLRLDADESTGDFKIIECRKEWQQGSSRSRRTCYTTEITFPCQTEEDTFSVGYSSSSSLSSSTSSTALAISSPKFATYDLSTFPDEPILRLLGPDDNPHHMQPPPRLPQYTHPDNDEPGQQIFTITDSPLRYYHKSAGSFLDLVNDPLPYAQRTQRLRLRAVSRKARPPLLCSALQPKKTALFPQPSSDLSVVLEETYASQSAQYWPPLQDTLHLDEDTDALYKLLNPPSHLGNVEGTADERSLVYVTGGYEKPQAIVFVGFDPAIKLVGLKRWGGIKEGMCQKGVGEGPHIDGRAHSGNHEDGLQVQRNDVDEADRAAKIKTNGKDKGRVNCDRSVQVSSYDTSVKVHEITKLPRRGVGEVCNWARQEKAMYRDIGLGFFFGLERNEMI